MGLSRFLGKMMLTAQGLHRHANDEGPGIVLEDDGTISVIGAVNIEGGLTATNAVVNAVQVKGGNNITAMHRAVYTWDIPAIAAMNVGSINSIVTQDVSMSGAAIGDAIFANPTASINALVGWDVACYTANSVKLRAWYTGSITLTPGNVPFKITNIKI